MPFDFNNFLTLADELSTRPDEASKRSSISRAYYTVFHLGLSRAEANVGSYRNRPKKYKEFPTHKWCWQQFMDTNDMACRKIGVAGDRMKKRRHSADYEANLHNLSIETQRQVAEARQFQADIARLDPRYPQP